VFRIRGQGPFATHDHEYLFPAIGGGLLANANFSYWQPVSRGRPASEEFTRVRLNQPQLVTSRRPLPEVPATAYAGKRLYLLRHGGKEWLDEDRHSRIAVETRMGHEVAGVEGLYSHVPLTMEQEIAGFAANQVAALHGQRGRALECAISHCSLFRS